MPRPTSSMLSKCCMTWMRPSTAPIMPTVGENPPAASKTLGDALFVLGLIIEFKLHHLAQFLGLGAVHRQHQRLVQKGFFDVLQFAVERHDAFLAGLVGETDDSFTISWGRLGIEKDMGQRRTAPNTTGRGNCNITAPNVPPKTIMAAVGCKIWETFRLPAAGLPQCRPKP